MFKFLKKLMPSKERLIALAKSLGFFAFIFAPSIYFFILFGGGAVGAVAGIGVYGFFITRVVN